ncbi:MAG: hypothetical protein PHD97_02890 [Bacteroidales bacterium]|nr:hypothetical protein [Bacteroidales bacterium]
MLLNDFFEIINLEVSPDKNTANAQIKINPYHKIFNGHFPNAPIVPGVCIVQMIKETLSKVVNADLMLVKGNNIKFFNIIVPSQNQIFNIDFKIKSEEENTFIVNSNISSGNNNFCGVKATFVKVAG